LSNNNNNNETSEEEINKLEQQVNNFMEQNVNLQSWINKYINTIKSMEKHIKQLQADLAREKEKKLKVIHPTRIRLL